MISYMQWQGTPMFFNMFACVGQCGRERWLKGCVTGLRAICLSLLPTDHLLFLMSG